MFVAANKRRDKAVADGEVEYDDRLTGLEDISDWKNPAFRYITVCPLLFMISIVANNALQ
jgi:hypothetical protein